MRGSDLEGFVNVDRYSGPRIDRVHDLDVHPWPFEDESVTELRAFDVYEHVVDPLGFMAEVWRVCRPQASVRLRTTKWDTRQSYTDPTHRRFLTEESFDYWIPGTEFHRKYGAGYSEGKHFRLDRVWTDGSELEWSLIRTDHCLGACDGLASTD